MNTNRFLLVNDARAKLAEIDRDLMEIKNRCFDGQPITKRAALMEHVGRISEYIEEMIEYRDDCYNKLQTEPIEPK